MKFLSFGLFIAALSFTACNNSGTTSQTAKTDTAILAQTTNQQNYPPSAMKGIVDGYLHLKNALAADNDKDAASAGSEILSAMGSVDTASMSEAQKTAYRNVADDVRENAEHISENAGKIEHQREHFEMLSKDMEDLVKTFGAGRQLYKDFCPMAAEGKGAYWLSEIKEIKNPYYGDDMLECGEVKEELK